MDFGLTNKGFIPKTLPEIKKSLEDGLKDQFGVIDTSPESVFGQFIGVLATSLTDLWEQTENVYYSEYPASASGQSLDGVAQLTGVVRLAATRSTAVVQLTGSEGTLVPGLTQVSQSVSPGNILEQVGQVEITSDFLHFAEVSVVTALDQVYIITVSGIPVTFTANGNTKEEIAENLANNINATTSLQDLVEAAYVPGEDSLTITIKNEIDPNNGDPLPLTISRTYSLQVGTSLDKSIISSPGNYRMQEPGKTAIPSKSIDTIETPVIGLDSVNNLEAGITGRNPETDSELRIRREDSLHILGAAVIDAILARIQQEVPGVTQVKVLENRTDDWVPAGSAPTGRAPHSIEVVALGGSNTDIAEKIWEVKAAGINTSGNTAIIITDENGDNQVINFTRPVSKYIYVKIEYSRAGAEDIFPSDGEDIIRNSVYSIGETYDIGEDVLLQRFFQSAYTPGGVTAATIYLAVSNNSADPAPTWVQTNLIIADNEAPIFENSTTRIITIDVT